MKEQNVQTDFDIHSIVDVGQIISLDSIERIMQRVKPENKEKAKEFLFKAYEQWYEKTTFYTEKYMQLSEERYQVTKERDQVLRELRAQNTRALLALF